MKLSSAKRKYLAAIFGWSAEFVISIILIGQLVTGRLSVRMTLSALAMTVVLISVGTLLIPEDREQKEENP